ncbi:MAG: envelope biogenesis factor ElyC [Candidatus Scalinduaceae bacterium]
MFLFKKIVAPFFLPIPFCLLISFLGLFLILFTRKQKVGKIMVSFGLCFLVLLSYDQVSKPLLAPLEHQYDACIPDFSAENELLENQNSVKYIVVLAGGIVPDPAIPILSQLSDSTLMRLIEGIRLYRKYPGSKLVLSGGGGSKLYTEAEAMADVAKSIGIDKSDIIIESDSRDTRDQAHFIKSIIDKNPFVLVTSAAHMPRSVALFKNNGMEPIPAPTMHLVRKSMKLTPFSFFPSSSALRKSEIAFHEYLGILWAKLRGQIQ